MRWCAAGFAGACARLVVVLLKACLNGARRPAEHPALPVSAEHLAADAAAARSAGAGAIHLHVKDQLGADTFSSHAQDDVLTATDIAVPGLPIGVTTGAWALPDPGERMTAIQRWARLPAFASVNWHEDGADAVARALLDRGVGVEAGLWHLDAVSAWAASPVRERCIRILIELPDGPGEDESVALAQVLLDAVGRVGVNGIPVLLHGEGSSCWPALRHAARLGLDTRIGLEDTVCLPDGRIAPNNEALVRAAVTLLS